MILFLFDVDGTLIINSKLHKESFKYALEKAGVDFVWDKKYDGTTDRFIIGDHLKTDDQHKIKQVIIDTTKYYKENISKETEIEVLPGVKMLLQTLSSKGFKIGLCTGNIRKVGFMKMGVAGLEKFFQGGGFGDLNVKRADLVKSAVDELGPAEKIYVVGDTPHDIQSVKDNPQISNLFSVAVSTGGFSRAQLKESNPDYCFETLNDPENFLKTLGNI